MPAAITLRNVPYVALVTVLSLALGDTLGSKVAIVDADFNGPTQARMTGLRGAVPVPGAEGIALPKTRDGVGVFSVGAYLPESEALDFASVSQGESHTWRATKEFAALGEVLASVAWGKLDVLLFDLPPGAERTLQFAEYLGAETSFLLVTIPSEVSRGVVARSVAALEKTENNLLGYVENMSGYYCSDCAAIKPLFPEAKDGISFDIYAKQVDETGTVDTATTPATPRRPARHRAHLPGLHNQNHKARGKALPVYQF
jgi:ATP-binding protein involved in chromosome partitioning